MDRLVTISSEIQSGMPVFAGTRVPVKNLFNYLGGGHSIDGFYRISLRLKKNKP